MKQFDEEKEALRSLPTGLDALYSRPMSFRAARQHPAAAGLGHYLIRLRQHHARKAREWTIPGRVTEL